MPVRGFYLYWDDTDKLTINTGDTVPRVGILDCINVECELTELFALALDCCMLVAVSSSCY